MQLRRRAAAPNPLSGSSTRSRAFFRDGGPAWASRRPRRWSTPTSRGILHRDIKPANLLLDGRGKLWVTDFGLARLQGDAGLTMTGDLLGTLRYMSPEQALAKRVVIDHRTDIYSLGVTLYELLTLRPAFDGQDRQEILRQIAFEEPTPPRRLEPGGAPRPGDDRPQGDGQGPAGPLRHGAGAGRRPATVPRGPADPGPAADAAGAGGEVVAAASHRGGLRGGGPPLDGRGSVVGLVLLGREQRQTILNLQLAQANKARADQRSGGKGSRLLPGRLPGAAAPSKTGGKQITIVEALADADGSIEGKFAKEPLVEAAVRQALAQVYSELGEYHKAEGHAERAFSLRQQHQGTEHEATLRAMFTLGWNEYNLARQETLDRGEAVLNRMLEICRRSRGDDDELTLTAMDGLACIDYGLNKDESGIQCLAFNFDVNPRFKNEDGIRFLEHILDVRRKKNGPSDPKTLVATNNLALALWRVGKVREAEPLLREVVDIGGNDDSPSMLNRMANYATLLKELNRIDDAAAWAVRSMDAHLRILKFKHPQTQQAILLAGLTVSGSYRDEEALRIIDRALEQARRDFGRGDSRTLEFLNLQTRLLCNLGDLAKAGSEPKIC